ncbi:MAG: HD domain-containing protein [Actinobacteria bacterium]|nr:HD domain-containing protein [Actinomycetota bacterium]
MPAQYMYRDRSIRQVQEEQLAPAATRSRRSRGRATPETADRERTCFEVDRDRILHAKAFRRLKHKTQVFIHPDGDHYVTRLSHALQVTQVARAIAAALGLNEPLVEAIAIGHDVGHTPFGHAGEDVLAEFIPGWQHGAQGVRIFDILEPVNLTWEVRDGIRAHTWKVTPPPSTPEAMCVRWADRIAYLTHDARDAIRAGLLAPSDLPDAVVAALGPPGGGWIGRLLRGLVDHTLATDALSMEPAMAGMMHELRAFMFERVYLSPALEAHKDAVIAVTRRLVEYHLEHPEHVPDSYREHDADRLRQVADYVAGMTDRYALSTHAQRVGPVPATRLREP